MRHQCINVTSATSAATLWPHCQCSRVQHNDLSSRIQWHFCSRNKSLPGEYPWDESFPVNQTKQSPRVWPWWDESAPANCADQYSRVQPWVSQFQQTTPSNIPGFNCGISQFYQTMQNNQKGLNHSHRMTEFQQQFMQGNQLGFNHGMTQIQQSGQNNQMGLNLRMT